ncbi:MAG: M23 family peptidase, partial [Betaproteobacteria bacterium]|nr:M23 family peptidase [Betaproteobacteria bacterium]
MSFFAALQSRLASLLIGALFLCTAVLGALLVAVQRVLGWLDGQHPVLTSGSKALAGWLSRHPKTISASVVSVLLAGGGGAFAIANFGPDIADQPVVSITVPVAIAQLEEQVQTLDLVNISLTRSDTTRSTDTPESLLRRLGIVDATAALFLRNNPQAKQALRVGGRAVTAEVDSQQRLLALNVRWLNKETDTFFQRLSIKPGAKGLQATLETSPMN